MKKVIIVLVLFLTLISNMSFAALTQNAAVMLQTPQDENAQFTNASSAGTYVTVYTGGANGSKVVSLLATNSDAVSHLVTCQIATAGTNYGGTAITVPGTSGFANSVPPVNIMASANWYGLPLDSDGNPFIFLTSTQFIKCTFATTVTTATVLNVNALGADF